MRRALSSILPLSTIPNADYNSLCHYLSNKYSDFHRSRARFWCWISTRTGFAVCHCHAGSLFVLSNIRIWINIKSLIKINISNNSVLVSVLNVFFFSWWMKNGLVNGIIQPLKCPELWILFIFCRWCARGSRRSNAQKDNLFIALGQSMDYVIHRPQAIQVFRRIEWA